MPGKISISVNAWIWPCDFGFAFPKDTKKLFINSSGGVHMDREGLGDYCPCGHGHEAKFITLSATS